MEHTTRWAALGALALLAACGTNPQERTSGGAAAGAATGAVVGAIAGPPGMVVGAVVGACGRKRQLELLDVAQPEESGQAVAGITPTCAFRTSTYGWPRTTIRPKPNSAADHSADQLNTQSYQNAQNGKNWQ